MWDNRRLPDSELDIMLVVWNAPAAISAPAILEGLERDLTASALHSYLKRLTDKGFLSCTKQGKVNTYLPLMSREAYRRCPRPPAFPSRKNGRYVRSPASPRQEYTCLSP